MYKDYNGYELIKEIMEGNIKENTKIGVFDLSVCNVFVTNIEYKNKKLNWEEGKFDTSYLVNPNCYFRIVEEQEEIDIQKIEELEIYSEIVSYDYRDIEINRKLINKLVQAVKQLDRQLHKTEKEQ